MHRACRKTRREFLICPVEGGVRGEVQLTQLDDNAGSNAGDEGSSIIAAECHLCHDGGIKCILGHRVPKESVDVIRYLKQRARASVRHYKGDISFKRIKTISKSFRRFFFTHQSFIRSLPTPPSAAVPAIPPKRTQCCEGRECPILRNQESVLQHSTVYGRWFTMNLQIPTGNYADLRSFQ